MSTSAQRALNRSLEAPRKSPPRGMLSSLGAEGALVPFPDERGTVAESRASAVHHQLLVAEREIADLREEMAMRSAEVEAMRSALQREHEQNLRLGSKHAQDLDHMRSEYERQNSQLVEQLTVLKGVSDAAMEEKRRLNEEGAQRKQQLMHLLEREREEKSQIMADYRQQTEQLITEQGREITGLRNLLEAAREEEEKLIAATKRQEERRSEAEEAMLKMENQLAEERLTAQRRHREVEQRHQTQTDSLRHQHDLEVNELRATVLRLTGLKESAEDQARSLAERMKQHEATSEAERARLRSAYDTDIDTLQGELKAAKAAKETNEITLRSELERSKAACEEIIANLRRDIDHLRHERQAAFDESRVQREVLVAEHTRRLNEFQAVADNARRELAEERALRKEHDSARQAAALECDSIKGHIARLTLELENTQVDFRTKERNAEQHHNDTLDKLHNAVRGLESELAKARSERQRAEVESSRNADDMKARISQLESDLLEARRKNEGLRIAAEDAIAQKDEADKFLGQQLDVLTARKITMEAEISRLERALTESEARTVAATKQLASERKALESATTEVQNQKLLYGDLYMQLEGEQAKLAAALATVAEKEADILRGKEAISDLNGHLREAHRTADNLRLELADLRRTAEDELQQEKAAHRRDVAVLEDQLSQASKARKAHQEAHQHAEEQLKALRDELIRSERQGIERDEAHQDVVRVLRREHEEELLRMDTVVGTLRDDLARAQSHKAQAQREALDATRDIDRRVAIVQEALEAERVSKQRLHDELRAKEQLIAEVQGTVRLLTTRLASKEEDLRRLESELQDATDKVHEAHSGLGRKEAVIGQLTAKLRVYEARGSL